MGDGWATWRVAMQRALYGPGGFFVRTPGQPAAHFRTSAHATPLFAQAVATLARSAGLTTVVDVGAGGGELLAALHDLDPSLQLLGVELAPRPASLAARIGWVAELPETADALVLANEWLDNVPVEVVQQAADGPRLVEVDSTGRQRLGAAPDPDDLAWLERWWPLPAEGDRAEVGRTRDEAWATVVQRLPRGVAVAVDYAHTRGSRPPGATLAGYRRGRLVDPVPDGSCDLTAHVALDACAAAGEAAGATATLLTTQAEVLPRLGVRPTRPDPALARDAPPAYLAALRDAGEAAELTDPGGLGGFHWLVQSTGGTPLPLLRSSQRPERTGRVR